MIRDEFRWTIMLLISMLLASSAGAVLYLYHVGHFKTINVPFLLLTNCVGWTIIMIYSIFRITYPSYKEQKRFKKERALIKKNKLRRIK